MARRRTVVLLRLLLAVAVLGPVLVVGLGRADEPPTAAASDGTFGATRTPVPTDAAAEAFDPETTPWLYVAQHFEQAPRSFNLQAGIAGGPGPMIDTEVPWVFDPAVSPGRRPAAGQAADGSVVYVEDDGSRSFVRRHALGADAAPETLGELEDIVWSIALTRDGSEAYLALSARDEPDRHTGVVRLALDGSGAAEPVMDGAVGADAVRLVAVSHLVEIRLAADERQLLRQLCTAARGCETDVLDLESGRTLAFDGTPIVGAAADAALIQRCGAAECQMEVVDLRTGESAPLDATIFEAVIVPVDGRPLVAAVTGDPMAADSTIELFDPATGAHEVVFRPNPPAAVSLFLVQAPLTYTMPPGYLLASVATGEAGAVAVFTTVAIPVAGGEPVALPEPPIRHEPAPGAQG